MSRAGIRSSKAASHRTTAQAQHDTLDTDDPTTRASGEDAQTTTMERRGNDGKRWRVMQGEAAEGGPWDLRTATSFKKKGGGIPTQQKLPVNVD